ncbi:endomucin isoform X3 [Grus americana]|uniref:endomucin isoform X3 n=1 Tax=Grus americana TaxID=9117 RepID=UPI00240814F0|nr:endomucin isoform X3 [Grus americana]
MKLLGIAFFFLAVLCVCTVGEGNTPGTVRTSASASTLKSVTEAVKASISQATTLQTSVLTTAVSSTNESIPSNSTPSSPNTTQQITQGAATQPPVKVTTTAADKSGSTTNTTQESGTQLAQNGSSGAPSTEGCFFSSTTSLHNTTSAPGTSNLASDGPRSSPGNKNASESTIHYSSVILPIVITLIVITLSVFSLVALYRMCQKKTPEGQENGTEQAQSDKEGVKLLSVKTTSPETGEHSSQGKNKTRQLFTPQQ